GHDAIHSSAATTLMASQLPLILIGPILRRVEPTLVSVFIATSRPSTIHLTLYDGIVDVGNPPPEKASVDGETQRIGVCFHATVVMLKLAGEKALQAGQRYSYDIGITPLDGEATSLDKLGLLKSKQIFGYGPPDPAHPEAGPKRTNDPRTQMVDICSLG